MYSSTKFSTEKGCFDKIIKNKLAIYDLKVDKTVNKIGNGNKLEKFDINKLPNFIQINQNDLKDWID